MHEYGQVSRKREMVRGECRSEGRRGVVPSSYLLYIGAKLSKTSEQEDETLILAYADDVQ